MQNKCKQKFACYQFNPLHRQYGRMLPANCAESLNFQKKILYYSFNIEICNKILKLEIKLMNFMSHTTQISGCLCMPRELCWIARKCLFYPLLYAISMNLMDTSDPSLGIGVALGEFTERNNNGNKSTITVSIEYNGIIVRSFAINWRAPMEIISEKGVKYLMYRMKSPGLWLTAFASTA